ncbi:MAG TPA: response regulator transcription factor [Thermoleophilaceae bacterium]|nr:response regulator transcription factor [Thermoleophilaceae bacterium]
MSRLRRTSVLVAEDHPLFRSALVDALKRRPDLELIGEAEDGRQALELTRGLRPDVVLMDARLPALDGVEVLRSVVSEQLPTRVLMLSAEASGPIVSEAMEIGAAGYLVKTADADAIGDAVSAVARGQTLAGEAQAAPERPALTARETEILALAAEGRSGPQIGQELNVAAATVKTHLGNIYAKLGVTDRAAAVAEGIRRGLVH